jgi:predicted AAA+ superfamily ATPase
MVNIDSIFIENGVYELHRENRGTSNRQIAEPGKSILLLGPRQTGKTTLLNRISGDFYLSFVRPDTRLRYEKNPGLLTGEVDAISDKKKQALVLLDEIQKVPEILDVVQDLIDRRTARFILTGSSDEDYATTAQTLAAFAEDDWNLTNKFTLSQGGTWDHNRGGKCRHISQ